VRKPSSFPNCRYESCILSISHARVGSTGDLKPRFEGVFLHLDPVSGLGHGGCIIVPGLTMISGQPALDKPTGRNKGMREVRRVSDFDWREHSRAENR
jgi:hypothetical protein